MTTRVRRTILHTAGMVIIALALGGSFASVTRAQATQATQGSRAAQATEQRPAIPATRESRFSRSADAEITFQEGLLHYNRGQLAQAEQEFKQILTDDPADTDAYYYLGLAQLDQNRPADAVPNFAQTVRLDPSYDEARAARATALIRLGRYDEAQADIDVVANNARFAGLAAYLRGQLAYAKGDLDAAQRHFAEARRSGEAEAAPAGFYEGLTYLRMRQLVRARQTFGETGGGGADADPTLAAAARQLDAVLAAQQPAATRRPWEAQLTLAYEYDTNVIQIGSDVAVPEGISQEGDSRFVLLPRGSYSFVQMNRAEDRIDLGVEANGYFAWQLDLTDFNIASYQLGPFITYKVTDNLFASFRYNFNYIDLGHEFFLRRHVFTPQVTYLEKDFGYTSAYYQLQLRQFADDEDDPDFDRDGSLHTLGIVQGINLPPLFRDAGPSNLEVSYRLDRQNTDGDDFDAWFNTLGAVYYTPLPIWKLRGDVGASVSYENYDNDNSLDLGGDKREDWEFNISTGLTRQFTKEIAVRVDYTYTDRNSNVTSAGGAEPFDYDRHQFGLRLIVSF